jgi:hypothetical protein
MSKKDILILKSFILSILVGIIVLSCVNYVNAEQQTLGVYKAEFCITLIQTCGSCSYNNITSVKSPNSTTLLSETSMTKLGTEYTYQFCDTSVLGTYIVNGFGDLDGTATVWAYDFEITGNGKPTPNRSVIVLFSLAFLIVVGFALFEFILSIGHLASLDLDVVDLAKSMGIYFVLIALYVLGLFYLGNPQIDSLLLIFIKVGGFTHIIIPLTGFLISITVGSLKKKKVDFGVKRIYRRQKIGN